MDACRADVEAAVPTASAGESKALVKTPSKTGAQDGGRGLSKTASKTQSSAKIKKKRSKMATTGGGDEKKKKPPPPKPNNTKKIVLASGLLLCLVSTVAIIMVLSGHYEPAYNASIEQFSGELQMEELDGDFIEWDEEYSNLGSAKARSLTSVFSEKLISSFDDEGIFVDEVSVTGLSPTEPKDFNRTIPVDESELNPSSRSYGQRPRATGGVGALYTPEQIDAVKVQTVMHTGVRFVSTNFVTMGTPSRNAAVFSSSNGRWSDVSNMIESRMGSNGMGVAMGSLKPQASFMNSVQQAVTANPALAYTAPVTPKADPCSCWFNGYSIFDKTKVCKCKSSCVTPGVGLWGGANNEFALHSPVCVAAYYAGITTSQGGIVEAVKTGRGTIRGGEKKNGIYPWSARFITEKYKVKSVGPVIQPPPPPSPTYAGSFGAGTSGYTSTSSGEKMFTIHLQFRSLDGVFMIFQSSMNDVKSSQSQQMIKKVVPKVKKAVESQGFKTSDVQVYQLVNPPEKLGVILGLEVKGQDSPNVETAVRLESEDPGELPEKIKRSLTADVVNVRSFRYSKSFIKKMTKRM